MQAEKASSFCCCCAICAGVGWPPFGSSLSQAVRADLNAGEPGSIPFPEWIVITPWPFGSGKFVTPCLRMQAENFAPSAVPTFIAIWNWPPRPPPGPLNDFSAGPEPLCVVDVVVVVPEEATLAIPGEPPPPPQPAASSTRRQPRRGVSMMGAAAAHLPEGITPIRLQRGNRSCYLRVTGAAASLRPAEGG